MKNISRSLICGVGRSLLLAFFLIVAGCVSDSNQVKPSLEEPVEISDDKQTPVTPPNLYWKRFIPPGAQDKESSSQNSAQAEENSSSDAASENIRDASLEDKEAPSTNEPEIMKKSDQELLDSALEFCQVSNDFWDKGDLDNALEALDEAYALILRVNAEKSADILQQRDDLRFTISKRIMEVYASKFIVANGLHTAIPLDMNNHVKKAITLFQGRERKNFLNAYRRSGQY
ncbi:MAG TPA: hypothetical protein HPP58_01090, partial [Deltaproteobacteria bacterium]|nr:hypothetical protein [Deltaproteobacteria bacterium]